VVVRTCWLGALPRRRAVKGSEHANNTARRQGGGGRRPAANFLLPPFLLGGAPGKAKEAAASPQLPWLVMTQSSTIMHAIVGYSASLVSYEPPTLAHHEEERRRLPTGFCCFLIVGRRLMLTSGVSRPPLCSAAYIFHLGSRGVVGMHINASIKLNMHQ
jgi:hypothetical protein